MMPDMGRPKEQPEEVLQNERVRKYLELAAIINNRLERENMVGYPKPQDYYRRLSSNNALRLAAQCLERYFNGPFTRRIGPKQVDTGSRVQVIPAEYFKIIQEAFDYQPKSAQDVSVESVAMKLDTLTVSNRSRKKETEEMEQIRKELNGISPLNITTRGLNDEKCLVPLELRLSAIFELYVVARQSNYNLRMVHREIGLKHPQLIDITLDMEIWSLMEAVRASVKEKKEEEMAVDEAKQLDAYRLIVRQCMEWLKDPLMMKKWVLQIVESRAWAKKREKEILIEAWEQVRRESGQRDADRRL